MGPPRTYDAIPPEVLDEYEEWIVTRAGADGFKDLIPVLEQKRWRWHRIICPATYYRLNEDQMAHVRCRARAILSGLGGSLAIPGVTWKTDGERIWVSLG